MLSLPSPWRIKHCDNRHSFLLQFCPRTDEKGLRCLPVDVL